MSAGTAAIAEVSQMQITVRDRWRQPVYSIQTGLGFTPRTVVGGGD